MGYGDGKVDWSIQAPTLMPDPGAYQRGQNQGLAEIYEKGADELVEISKAWRAKAIHIQEDLDAVSVSGLAWKETALFLREEYAPHLQMDDLIAKQEGFKPAMQKKYYNEFISKRTWDK